VVMVVVLAAVTGKKCKYILQSIVFQITFAFCLFGPHDETEHLHFDTH
jgi:hypothetical protein